MPYIDEMTKDKVSPYLKYLLLGMNESYGTKPGVINYIITSIIYYWWRSSAQNYETLNAIQGCLDCVSKEFYRRIVVPYEEKKCAENGDVFNAERF